METMTPYNNKPVILFNSTPNLIYCDEELPPRNKWVAIVVVEVDHGQSTSSPLYIEIDSGYVMDDGNWSTSNDWDEGQPWAVVAWMPLPDEATVRSHEIKWMNAPSK